MEPGGAGFSLANRFSRAHKNEAAPIDDAMRTYDLQVSISFSHSPHARRKGTNGPEPCCNAKAHPGEFGFLSSWRIIEELEKAVANVQAIYNAEIIKSNRDIDDAKIQEDAKVVDAAVQDLDAKFAAWKKSSGAEIKKLAN